MKGSGMEAMKKAIRRANIIRDKWPIEYSKNINLYQGSGAFGGCFDAYGLMHQDEGGISSRVGNTAFHHQDFFHRGIYGIDMHLPLVRICWENLPPAPREYSQELDLYKGRLTTRFINEEIGYTMEGSFDPHNRNQYCLRLDYSVSEGGKFPRLLFRFPSGVKTSYGEQVCYDVDISDEPGRHWGKIRAGTGKAEFAILIKTLSGRGFLSETADGEIRFALSGKKGSVLFLFTLNNGELPQNPDPSFFSRAASSWKKRWGDAYLDIEECRIHKLWTRGLYYLLCSYAPNGKVPSPQMGWTGNNWDYHFPQDMSFLHPVLLKTGHFDIARSIVEYYHSHLDNMKAFTQRIYDLPGVMWAWEFPAARPSEQLLDGAPNHFQYEIHNNAYVVRMAYETWRYTKDDDWGRRIAWPIIEESCRFYLSALGRNERGTWGMHVIPSMGQDEYGGEDKPDYLCSLFSAQYCLERALHTWRTLSVPFPDKTVAQKILEDGLAYPELYHGEKGLYKTCSTGDFRFGLQKHPVQLNPLCFVPLSQVDEPTLRAYKERHLLCQSTDEFFYNGWTLFAYMAAAVNGGDIDGYAHELNQLISAQLTDPDLIQIYETSRFWQPYYTASHGLFMQALLGGVVNDFGEKTRIGWCVPDLLGDIVFSRIRTLEGDIVSGSRYQGSWSRE